MNPFTLSEVRLALLNGDKGYLILQVAFSKEWHTFEVEGLHWKPYVISHEYNVFYRGLLPLQTFRAVVSIIKLVCGETTNVLRSPLSPRGISLRCRSRIPLARIPYFFFSFSKEDGPVPPM